MLFTISQLLLCSDMSVTFPQASMGTIRSGLCSCFAITKVFEPLIKDSWSIFTNRKLSNPIPHSRKAENMFSTVGSIFKTIRFHKSEAETHYQGSIITLFLDSKHRKYWTSYPGTDHWLQCSSFPLHLMAQGVTTFCKLCCAHTAQTAVNDSFSFSLPLLM